MKHNTAHHKATIYILLGQISLLSGLTICYLILPGLLQNEGGLSNYGVHGQTVVPFSVGLGLASLFTFLAALYVRPKQRTAARLPVLLKILAGLFIFVLLSTYPYKLTDGLNTLHRIGAISLFSFEVGLGIWLTLVSSRSWLNIALLFTFLAGSFISLISLLGMVHLLFIGQTIAGVAFAGLLVRMVRRLAYY